MRGLVVSERAEADLRAIWLYSLAHWGEAQADRYLDALEDGMRKCAADPECGKQRDTVRPGYRSLLIRKHVAFYSIGEDNVLIQRVLHSSMDPIRHV